LADLYSNENFPIQVVHALRGLGQDVLTIQETGRADAALPDADVLAYASSLNRVCLTLNRRDFIRLHAVSDQHAGTVVCTFDPDFAAQAERIDRALAGERDLRRKLIRVNRPG
jgi:hypothetical protein